MLQCAAVCCSEAQCVAAYCSALQCVAVRYQCVAACCSFVEESAPAAHDVLHVCCGVLQCVVA